MLCAVLIDKCAVLNEKCAVLKFEMFCLQSTKANGIRTFEAAGKIMQCYMVLCYTMYQEDILYHTSFFSLRSRRYTRAQGWKHEILPAQKLSILSSPAAG